MLGRYWGPRAFVAAGIEVVVLSLSTWAVAVIGPQELVYPRYDSQLWCEVEAGTGINSHWKRNSCVLTLQGLLGVV